MDPQYELLLKYVKARFLVSLNRKPESLAPLEGYVLDFSNELLLLQRFLWDPFSLNGYTVVPVRDVASFEVFDNENHWVYQAIEKTKFKPKKPRALNLQNWDTLISDSAKKFPLLSFEAERKDPDNVHLAKFVHTDNRKVVFHKLDFEGQWHPDMTVSLKHLTQVSFGGGYEGAYAAVMPQPPTVEKAGEAKTAKSSRKTARSPRKKAAKKATPSK